MLQSDEISQSVKEFFRDAQLSNSGHRKLVHKLNQLHRSSAQLGEEGEKEFFLAIIHCLNMLLAIKRSEEVVNRSIRFLVGFIVWSAAHDEDSVLGGPTSTTRLIENLMLYALEGVDSKEKSVRAKLCQILVACVSSLDELGDDVWRVFRVKMIERLFDKEAVVRVHSVHAMSRLQSLPLTENDESGGLIVLDIFLELLAHDPSAEVRKAVLANIEVNERTLESIILRRKDVDTGVRRFFFSQKMNEIDVRILSIKQRDLVLRAGLSDRDGNVRRSCIEMVFGQWIKVTNNNLIQLLLSLDVIRNTKVAEDALKAFFEMTPDMFTEFNEPFLENLTPETALAMTVYCKMKGSDQIDGLLPEISSIAGHIKRIYESVVAGNVTIEQRIEEDFVLIQLFNLVKLMDKSDEMGRRVMQEIIIEMMANLELSESVFKVALESFSLLCPDFRNFLHFTGQLISDLYDISMTNPTTQPLNGTEDILRKSMESLTISNNLESFISEDIRIMAQLRCLLIISTIFQLPQIQSDNPSVIQLLSDIVIPAINSPYAVIQNEGLICLGLVCLINKELALEYLELFIDFFKNGQEETRITALKVLFDISMIYPDDNIPQIASSSAEILSSLYDNDIQLQSIAAEGYSKLFLHRRLTDPSIIVGLFQTYYHPTTASNPRLRQILTYFFQAFAYSSAVNQNLLSNCVVLVLEALTTVNNNLSINLSNVASQLLELTDPALLADQTESNLSQNSHAILAESLAWSTLKNPERSKLYAGLLCKIRIDQTWPCRSLKRLLFVMGHIIRTVTDRALLTSLKKTVALLVELDDPAQLLEPSDLIELRERLANVANVTRATEILVPGKVKSTVRQQKEPVIPVNNVLDNLSDILDE